MSRIGKKTIEIPKGVTVQVKDSVLLVRGPKGELQRILHPAILVVTTETTANVDIKDKENLQERALWGTFAAHLRNMIVGVTEGFVKKMEINGVGYRVAMQGTDLKLEVGFSHPVIFKIPTGAKASVEKAVITLESADKELLGRVAAELRAVRKPEPYKGKGIKYADEHVRRKAGKAAKAAAA